jgi:hypothetical protein
VTGEGDAGGDGVGPERLEGGDRCTSRVLIDVRGGYVGDMWGMAWVYARCECQ